MAGIEEFCQGQHRYTSARIQDLERFQSTRTLGHEFIILHCISPSKDLGEFWIRIDRSALLLRFTSQALALFGIDVDANDTVS